MQNAATFPREGINLAAAELFDRPVTEKRTHPSGNTGPSGAVKEKEP